MRSQLVSSPRHPMIVVLLTIQLTALVTAQPFRTGDLVPDLAFTPRLASEPNRLKDAADEVTILAFFTQWCRSCRTALESLSTELMTRSFENTHQLPIKLIAVNLESDNPDLTDQFITTANLSNVIDDTELDLWDAFAESNSIPLLVVINGVRESPSHRDWEIVHKQIGLRDLDGFLTILDGIQPAQTQPPQINPFNEFPADSWGWREVPWFGRINDSHFPWIYHPEHEWLYIARQSTAGELYAYDPAMGWLYFSPQPSPQVFNFTRNTWMRANLDSEGNREFFDQTAQEWLAFPTEQEARPGGRNGFVYTNALIPTSEIRSGGPPRDGIPALLDPSFVSQETASEFMQEDDVVISVTHNGETRAYPFRILNWHEVVNDQIGDLHFAATYCPLCGTAIVFDRNVNDRILTFGVSGLLYLDNVLMYDHQTESLWSQLFLQSVTGSQFGTPLNFVPSTQMLYRNWREKYPQGTVLSTDTGHARDYTVDPYAGYFLDPDPLFPVGDIRNDLQAKAWVYGVLVEGSPIAFSREQLPSGKPFTHHFNGKNIDVSYDDASQSIQVTDQLTGQPLTGLWSFWFAWQAFHPTTELWIGSTE